MMRWIPVSSSTALCEVFVCISLALTFDMKIRIAKIYVYGVLKV
jgi:hypothetical protein